MSNFRFSFAVTSLLVALLALLSVWNARPAMAHPMPDSRVMLDINRDSVGIEIHVPLVELEVAYAKPLSQDPNGSIARYRDDLSAYFQRHIVALSPDGKPWRVEVTDVKRGQDQTPPYWPQPTPYVDAHVRLTPPPGAPVRNFTLNYDVVVHQLVTHVALVSIRHDWNNGVFSDSSVVLGELRDFNKTFKIELPTGSPWRGFASIVHLGMRHIAEGTDHLLFLLVLLLPAGLQTRGKHWGEAVGIRESLRRLVKIVTAFTIGHSITLAAGALGWIHVPSAPIETLIALSIFVSAVHALRPLFPGREAFIAAGFGLIHGLAFAGVVADFRLDTWHTVLAILGFNVGIELMQLFVVAIMAPWLLLLARTSSYAPFRIGGACIAGIAALGWMAERCLGWNNPLGTWVEKAAAQAVWLVVSLAVLAVVMTLLQRRQKTANEPPRLPVIPDAASR